MIDQLRAVLEAAEARPRAETWTLEVAGHPWTVHFTDSELADAFTPALGHLAGAAGAPPELEVVVGMGPLPAPLPGLPDVTTGEHDDRYLVEVDGVRAFLAPGAPLWLLDTARGRALCWYHQLEGPLPSWERGAPLRVLFHWWGGGHGLHLTHAAAVGDDTGAVLLVGPGGSGKSTTSLAAAVAGWGYLSDDYCLVEPNGAGGPQVHCLYGTGKCDARSLALVPELARLVVCPPSPDGPDGDKAVLHMAGAVVPRAPVRAVVVPVVGAGVTGLTPIPGAMAVRALAPSTMFQMPGLQAGTFSAMVGLVRRVETYRLGIGGDPAAAIAALAGLRQVPVP